jgi:potassium/chloride transporter 9
MKIPDAFMSSSNNLIRERCKNTAIVFMYLPLPRLIGMDENEATALRIRHLELLSILTENLPPTVLVHGIHAVTSTAI